MTVRPFDQRDAVAENVFVKAEPQDGIAIFEPVEIEVVNRQAAVAVFVHQDKSGTSHFRRALDAGNEAFHKLGLAGAQISGQREDIAPARLLAVGPPGRDRLLSAF